MDLVGAACVNKAQVSRARWHGEEKKEGWVLLCCCFHSGWCDRDDVGPRCCSHSPLILVHAIDRARKESRKRAYEEASCLFHAAFVWEDFAAAFGKTHQVLRRIRPQKQQAERKSERFLGTICILPLYTTIAAFCLFQGYIYSLGRKSN